MKIGILQAGHAAPAMAELNAGYDAWNRGDYKTAVREWRDLAAQGVRRSQKTRRIGLFRGLGGILVAEEDLDALVVGGARMGQAR